MSTSLTVISERLGSSEIFCSLSNEDLMEIASFCQEEVYQDGQVVFVEDEPANQVLVVERGKLAIEKLC